MIASSNDDSNKYDTYLKNIRLLYTEEKYRNIKKLFKNNLETDFKKHDTNQNISNNLKELFEFFRKFEKERLKVYTALQNPGFIKKINLFIDQKTYEIEKLFNFNEKDFGFHLF